MQEKQEQLSPYNCLEQNMKNSF